MSLHSDEIFWIVVYTLASVLGLLCNSIIIVIITKSRELHQPTLWNIAVMAAWDLLFWVYTLVLIVPSKILNEFAYPESSGRVLSVLFTFIVTQNAFNIMLALIDRYISIFWPLHYPRLMSARRFTLAFIILLLFNILRCGILLGTDGTAKYKKSLGVFTQVDPTRFRTISRILAFIIALIIVSLTIRIRVELGKKTTNGNPGNMQSVSTQFTYTMFVSTLVYCVCYFPATIVLIINDFMKEESALLNQFGFIFIASNSLWNIFIYAATYRPFRKSFQKLVWHNYYREQERRDIQVWFRDNRVSVTSSVQ